MAHKDLRSIVTTWPYPNLYTGPLKCYFIVDNFQAVLDGMDWPRDTEVVQYMKSHQLNLPYKQSKAEKKTCQLVHRQIQQPQGLPCPLSTPLSCRYLLTTSPDAYSHYQLPGETPYCNSLHEGPFGQTKHKQALPCPLCTLLPR